MDARDEETNPENLQITIPRPQRYVQPANDKPL